LLRRRVKDLWNTRQSLNLQSLNEFVLSPTFYYVYQGYNDRLMLSRLQEAYSFAFPSLTDHSLLINRLVNRISNTLENSSNIPIRIGFVSAHFRRHSICKLFCDVITSLDDSIFDVYIFSSVPESKEDERTKELREVAQRNDRFHFISIGQPLIKNRNEVIDRDIDILVSIIDYL
jgi:predicted O-linked N-acetylglucosamine transferase (SPINDLY family)